MIVEPMEFSTTFNTRVDLLLASWFDKKAVAAGRKLLGQGCSRLFYRGCSSLLWHTDPVSTILQFKSKPRSKHGFAITTAFCSKCGMHHKGGFCSHLAATALVSLVPWREMVGQPFPAPLLWNDSLWPQLARHVYHRWKRGRVSLSSESGSPLLLLEPNGIEMAAITVPEGQRPLLAIESGVGDNAHSQADRLTELKEQLQKLEASETEAALNARGMLSVGQRQDLSLPSLLMALLASRISEEDIRFVQQENNFHLTGSSKDERYSLRILMPASPNSELVLQEAAHRLAGLTLCPDEAEEFCRLELGADGSLLATPAVRLADGRTFSQQELAWCRFGSHFFLPAEGLRHLRRQDDAVTIRPPRPQRTNLFELATPTSSPEAPFSISSAEAPDFLARHAGALHCPANDIDAPLLDLTLREKPDSLVLDSCRRDEQGWFYLSGHYGVGNLQVPILEVLTALREGRDYLPSSGLLLGKGDLAWLADLGEERGWHLDGMGEGIKLSALELLRLASQLAEVRLPDGAPDEKLASLLNSSSWHDSSTLPEKPDHLREYQVTGLAWLHALYRHGLGGILADDMGLGKTHQALALIWLLCRQDPQARFLVVCPATVASHWQMKAGAFYEELRVQLYHGSGRSLEQDAQVIITTYGLLSRDEPLREIHFNAIIFDEMQQVKNKQTKVHQSACQLRASCLIGLSGTPIENSSLDLKALLDICLPGMLEPDNAFIKRYGGKAGPERLEELSRRLSPFILRRDRQQVLKELPDTIDDLYTCELNAEQVSLYRQAIGEAGKELQQALADDRQGMDYSSVLTLVTRLKQICNHPALLNPECGYGSGKWELFQELLAESLAARLKVVVFSQYTAMLDIIEAYLRAEAIGHAGLRGSMSVKQRAAMIARFQEDPECRVFCASLLAGGVGVDLTAAQVVIHYDRWWNAAREDQATARVHRMGQKKVVQVCRLITVGTLEEKIHQLIERRRELATQVIKQDDASMLKGLSRDDLRELLSWRD